MCGAALVITAERKVTERVVCGAALDWVDRECLLEPDSVICE